MISSSITIGARKQKGEVTIPLGMRSVTTGGGIWISRRRVGGLGSGGVRYGTGLSLIPSVVVVAAVFVIGGMWMGVV